MNRRTSPGLWQWLSVTVFVGAVLFLFYKMYQYSFQRTLLPAGLAVGSVNVGGRTLDEAEQLLNERYILSAVRLIHPNGQPELNPADAGMVLDMEYMLSQADYQRRQQNIWEGFWGYLWNRPVNVEDIKLTATHDPDRLRRSLQIIADQLDEEIQPPQPVPASLSFQFGESGIKTDVSATLRNVESALYRTTAREARMVANGVEPERPEMLLLGRLLINHVQSFSDIVSIYILDLQTGQEITYRADIAMSGMDMLKLPISLEALRLIDFTPTVSQTQLIQSSLIQQGNHESANQLLNMIAGKDDPYLGADLVTESLNKLGLTNSFMLTNYGAPLRSNKNSLETSANSRDDFVTNATPAMQTTAEDFGTLLAMIYYCAQDSGGALPLVFPDEITPEECQLLLDQMSQNSIGSLIEGGVPQNTQVAHRHAWINDTHGDAGIVFTPGGDYVIAMFLYKPDWLEWEISSPIMADISRATYNYFNFAEPFLDGTTTN